jgi:predicted peroxiredoxin
MIPRSRAIAMLVCLAIIGLTVGFGSISAPAAAAPRDGVFIHLTKGPDDAHGVVMALKMANLMAADRDVLVYCDLKGINTVLKDAPEITFPTFDSARFQIKSLLDKSIPVYACPSCLKALGKTPDDLMPGVKMAEKDAFFSFTKGRILTLDY